MGKHFVIDQVSWHTTTPGDPEPMEHARRRFFSVVSFLQKNKLVVREMAKEEGDITEGFAIGTSDLTDDGLALMKLAYEKWVGKIDHGMDPADVSVLEQALRKIRSQ